MAERIRASNGSQRSLWSTRRLCGHMDSMAWQVHDTIRTYRCVARSINQSHKQQQAGAAISQAGRRTVAQAYAGTDQW